MSRTLLINMFICLCLSFWACKDKQQVQQDVAKETMNKTEQEGKTTKREELTILCFGNSLTAGYGLEEEEAWPSLLQERLDSEGYKYNVVNAGLSGETTSGGLNRIDWVLSQPVDIFFLELGANDMLRGIDVNSTEENLKQILLKVQEKYPGIPMIIAGMLSPPNMGKDYETSFNQIFPSLAKEFDAVLIPFFLEGVAGIEKLNIGDGKHPNAEGQKIVLENVYQVMQSLLKK